MVDVADETLPEKLRRIAAAEDPEVSAERWDVILQLWETGGRAEFTVAKEFAASQNLGMRLLGIDILCKLGPGDARPFLDEAVPILLEASTDANPDVRATAVIALGNHRDPRSLAAILARADDPDDGVRDKVAHALPIQTGDENPPQAALDCLIALSTDPVDAIRDWATMALANVDGPRLSPAANVAIADALAARADDADEGARAEAIRGLTYRGDPRGMDALIRALEDEYGGTREAKRHAAQHTGYTGNWYRDMLTDAVCDHPDPRLLPILLRLRAEDDLDVGNRVRFWDDLDRAIEAVRRSGSETGSPASC